MGDISETGPLATDVHLLTLPGNLPHPEHLKLRKTRGDRLVGYLQGLSEPVRQSLGEFDAMGLRGYLIHNLAWILADHQRPPIGFSLVV